MLDRCLAQCPHLTSPFLSAAKILARASRSMMSRGPIPRCASSRRAPSRRQTLRANCSRCSLCSKSTVLDPAWQFPHILPLPSTPCARPNTDLVSCISLTSPISFKTLRFSRISASKKIQLYYSTFLKVNFFTKSINLMILTGLAMTEIPGLSHSLPQERVKVGQFP